MFNCDPNFSVEFYIRPCTLSYQGTHNHEWGLFMTAEKQIAHLAISVAGPSFRGLVGGPLVRYRHAHGKNFPIAALKRHTWN